MLTQLMTQKEFNSLIEERDSLQKQKELSTIYEAKALSPKDYLSLVKDIKELNDKIDNARIIPQIKLNRKFTVKVDEKLISMIITINQTKMKNIICCTFNSVAGKALLDKMVGDIIEIDTPDGLKTYEVINIEEN